MKILRTRPAVHAVLLGYAARHGKRRIARATVEGFRGTSDGFRPGCLHGGRGAPVAERARQSDGATTRRGRGCRRQSSNSVPAWSKAHSELNRRPHRSVVSDAIGHVTLLVTRGTQRWVATGRSESAPTSSASGSSLRRSRVPQSSHSTTRGRRAVLAPRAFVTAASFRQPLLSTTATGARRGEPTERASRYQTGALDQPATNRAREADKAS
jgi:hypothetical protein